LRLYHDLAVYHRKRGLHGMTLVAGWARDVEDRSWKRTLYLMPAGYYGEGMDRVYWLVETFHTHAIALDAGKDIGRVNFAYEQASAALQRMGLTDSLTNRHLVIAIINDHLDDLTLMPPRPKQEQQEAADIVINNALTGERHEAVVMKEV
jgi:hypothetical protein